MAKKKVASPTNPIDDLVGDSTKAAEYEKSAIPADSDDPPKRFVKKWSAGMARHFRVRFAKQLKALREAAGLSIRQLAHRANVDHSQLLRLESAERSCTLETAVQIAGALGVSLGILTDEPASTAN